MLRPISWVDEVPQSSLELTACLSRMATLLEFEYWAIGTRFPLPLTRPRVALVTSYPKAWEQRYVDQGYHRIDPSVALCLGQRRPIAWNDQLFEGAEEMWDEAQSFGLKEGCSQSSRDSLGIVSMLTFARSSSPVGDAELRAKGREMNALLELAHKFMLQAMRTQILEEFSSPLSSREIEILRWAADGKTGKDIAQILGISLATVRFHTAKSITKLHAPNLQSAIARALMLDVLQDAR